MTAKPTSPAPILPASTVLLLRDDPAGLLVFMVERHHAIDFASGALVFPGGKVDAGDHETRVREHTAGTAALDDAALALRIAAIREAFEEAGVLLARPAGGGALIDDDRLAALGRRYRADLEAGRLTIGEMAAAEGLELAVDLLVPFARWITPDVMPRRFDTHFFLAPATDAHFATARHDGGEAVESVWIRPADALAEASAGRRTVIFATEMNLAKLANSATVADALARARRDPIVTVMPEVLFVAGGRRLRIPAAAGYGVTEVVVGERGGRLAKD